MSGNERDGDRQSRGGQQDGGRSPAEWATLVVSAGILLLLIGLVTYQYLTESGQPPRIQTAPQLRAVRQEDGAYYLPVRVTNTGGEAARDVRVRVSLDGGREAPEFSIDSLASGETVEGVVVTDVEPSQGSIAVDIISFTRP